jgi:hypothetical protein
MTRRRKDIPLIGEIQPDAFYRVTLSPALFDLGWQSTKDKIRSGELPPPFPMTEGSKCEGWTGRQILDHRARMQALAAEKLEARRSAPKQPQPKNFEGKTRKRKLQPPPPAKQRKRQRAKAGS